MRKLFLFDVDGTLVESSQKISKEHARILNALQKHHDIGVVGGGNLPKILQQMDGLVRFDHYFTECGSVYHDSDMNEVHRFKIRDHPRYPQINVLIKTALGFLSNVDYTITGHFIDLRDGLVYISLVGMNATHDEREAYKCINVDDHIRLKLLDLLKEKSNKLGVSDKLDINIGGSVGIAIYPSECDKIQVLDTVSTQYEEIFYFGDKYQEGGNDHRLIKRLGENGICVDDIEDTYKKILDDHITYTSA